MSIQVGFRLVGTHMQAVGARIGFPVDGGDLVTGVVVAVFPELHAPAAERTGMDAAQKSVDQECGPELQVGEARQKVDVQIIRECVSVFHPGSSHLAN